MAFGVLNPLNSPSRPLTTNERILAQSVFGNTIDYDKVRIHSGRAFLWQPDDTFITPNGHIYDPTPNGYLFNIDAGGTGATLAQKNLFIHEMTHVWQEQYYRQPGSENAVSSDFARARWADTSYNYNAIFSGSSFADLGIEKQAAFLGDYYELINSPYGTSINGKTIDDFNAVPLPAGWQENTYPVIEGGIRVEEEYNGNYPIQPHWSWQV